MLGQVYNVQPVAPDPEHTVYLDAGPLRIGVEYREVDPEALSDYYEGADLDEIEANSPEGGFTDKGVSIHIESVADEHEYIRFDVFDDEPHYHYVDKAAGTNTLIGFDTAAHGEMMSWVIDAVENRLPAMLEAAGAPELASELDDTKCGTARRVLVGHLESIGVLGASS